MEAGEGIEVPGLSGQIADGVDDTGVALHGHAHADPIRSMPEGERDHALNHRGDRTTHVCAAGRRIRGEAEEAGEWVHRGLLAHFPPEGDVSGDASNRDRNDQQPCPQHPMNPVVGADRLSGRDFGTNGPDVG